jgi:hypothetical protein
MVSLLGLFEAIVFVAEKNITLCFHQTLLDPLFTAGSSTNLV